MTALEFSLPLGRELSCDDLRVAQAEVCARIAAFKACGMTADEAAICVADWNEAIIEGESCAYTLLRFGIVAHIQGISRNLAVR